MFERTQCLPPTLREALSGITILGIQSAANTGVVVSSVLSFGANARDVATARLCVCVCVCVCVLMQLLFERTTTHFLYNLACTAT